MIVKSQQKIIELVTRTGVGYRVYVDDFYLNNYISLLTGMEGPEDCMEPCRDTVGCAAWTFDQVLILHESLASFAIHSGVLFK